MLSKPWKSINFILAVLFSIMYAFLALLLALFMMRAVDATVEGNISLLIRYIIYVTVLAVCEYLVNIISRYFTLKYIRNNIVFAKNFLFQNTIKGFADTKKMNLAHHSTDIDILARQYYLNHVLIIGAISLSVFSIIGILLIHWIMLVAVVVASMLPMLAPVIFQKRYGTSIQNYSIKSDEYINYVKDVAEGIQEVKIFSVQHFFNKMHGQFNIGVEKARFSNGMIGSLLRYTSEFFGTFVFIVIIGIGGLLTIEGIVTIGALIAVIQLLNGVVQPIGQISTYIGEISGSKQLLKNYFEETADETGENANDLANHIKINNISFAYPDAEKPVLSNINLEFKKGLTYAITGESGSGKSTLAKIISGILPPTEGEIIYDGQHINSLKPSSYAAQVKYIHQNPHLFQLSIRDNITFGINNDKCIDFIKEMRLSELIHRIDGENIDNREIISGGEKSRISIARSLNFLPSVLILDEPTANLDYDTAVSIIKYLQTFNITLIIITHEKDSGISGLFDEIINI